MDNEQLMSLVTLLRSSLVFYAEPANYSNGQIQKDGGHIAKSTLETIKNIEGQMTQYKDFFMDMEELKKLQQDEPEIGELVKFIEEIKNQNDGRESI